MSAAAAFIATHPKSGSVGSGGSGGSSGSGGSNSGATGGVDNGSGGGGTKKRRAYSTVFDSYPAPGSSECKDYNGCKWAGQFAGLSKKQSREWVKSTNIAAVHKRDWPTWKLKRVRVSRGGKSIEATVYDYCDDKDCKGCCTKNAKMSPDNFLIDLEKNTFKRLGLTDNAIVDVSCLNC